MSREPFTDPLFEANQLRAELSAAQDRLDVDRKRATHWQEQHAGASRIIQQLKAAVSKAEARLAVVEARLDAVITLAAKSTMTTRPSATFFVQRADTTRATQRDRR